MGLSRNVYKVLPLVCLLRHVVGEIIRVSEKKSGTIKLVIPSKCPYPRVGCGGRSLYVRVELKPLPGAIAATVCYCMFFLNTPVVSLLVCRGAYLFFYHLGVAVPLPVAHQLHFSLCILNSPVGNPNVLCRDMSSVKRTCGYMRKSIRNNDDDDDDDDDDDEFRAKKKAMRQNI